jgi:hypothetical protein
MTGRLMRLRLMSSLALTLVVSTALANTASGQDLDDTGPACSHVGAGSAGSIR